jgi:crotonobetainyl-CoA:carnitine CoA-transferase CaiB-like acyl-CoA transferase
MGTSFLAQNANKRSVTLNTKSPEGKEIFRRLVRDADVLVENFRPGVMDRLGLGWFALREINPRLVYCAISGFGQDGPDAFKPAYDQIIQGLSGEMAVNGDERLTPLRTGFPVCDTVGGLNAAFALMAALYQRERTGRGQFIDVALLDSIMPLMGWVAANLLIGGQDPVVMGNDNFTAAPSGTFRTRDGYINIAANKQEQWEAVCRVLDLPDLLADPRFQERDTRKRSRRALRIDPGPAGGPAPAPGPAPGRPPEDRGGWGGRDRGIRPDGPVRGGLRRRGLAAAHPRPAQRGSLRFPGIRRRRPGGSEIQGHHLNPEEVHPWE